MSECSKQNASLSPIERWSPSASVPVVSIIIPHYNDLKNLSNCLSLLAAQTMNAKKYEIVVADNNSKCGIDAVKDVCGSQARVVPAPIQGAGEARNAAVRASRGTILAFIDSDCRAKPQWLEEGVKALNSADIIGGQVDVDYEDPSHPTDVEAFEKLFAFDFKKYVEKDKYSGTGNMFVLRSTFDKVGGFCAGVSEDREWGNRAVNKGFTLKYAQTVVVSHPARKNWEELKKKWLRTIKETYLLNSSKPYSSVRWFIYCCVVFVSPFIHIKKIITSNKISGFSIKLSAMLVLFKLRWARFFWGSRLLFSKG